MFFVKGELLFAPTVEKHTPYTNNKTKILTLVLLYSILKNF